MPTPAYSTSEPVRGQIFNLSAVIRSLTTGNPLTSGLGTLTAFVQKDDGGFNPTTNTPVQSASTGWVSLDLTAAEMTASKVDVEVRSSITGSVNACISLAPLDLSGSYTTTVLGQAIKRPEQFLRNVWQYFYNQNAKAGAQQILQNDDGIPMASAVITEGDGMAVKGAMR